MASAAVAVIVRKEKQMVQAFRDAGALTPDRAITLESIGMHHRLAYRKLRNRGVLREAAPNYFYLDEARWAAVSKLRRTMAVIAIIVAIVIGNHSYIVDAGAGIVRRAAAAAKADSAPALTAPNLRIVFLTHLHSDHTVGLPDLMLTPWVLERTGPLDVYGPPGTRDMVANLSKAYKADVDIRLHGGEPSNKTGYVTRAHEIKAGVVYSDSLVTVTAFEVQHGQWPHAFAYRFVTHDRTIVVSGDTKPSQAIIDACNGCDVLVHEVYSAEKFKVRPAGWQAYHSKYHTSTTELADIATKARPKLLVLYHQLYWGDDDAGLLRQIRAHYSGKVESAHDLGVY